jgi:hypothetical protein
MQGLPGRSKLKARRPGDDGTPEAAACVSRRAETADLVPWMRARKVHVDLRVERSVVVPRSIELPRTQTAVSTHPTFGVGSAQTSVRTETAVPTRVTFGVGLARASVREVTPDTPAAAPSASAARWAQPFRLNTNLHPPKLVLPPFPQCDEMTVSERATAFRAWLHDCGQARSEFTKSYDDFTETIKRCAFDRMPTVLSVNGWQSRGVCA